MIDRRENNQTIGKHWILPDPIDLMTNKMIFSVYFQHKICISCATIHCWSTRSTAPPVESRIYTVPIFKSMPILTDLLCLWKQAQTKQSVLFSYVPGSDSDWASHSSGLVPAAHDMDMIIDRWTLTDELSQQQHYNKSSAATGRRLDLCLLWGRPKYFCKPMSDHVHMRYNPDKCVIMTISSSKNHSTFIVCAAASYPKSSSKNHSTFIVCAAASYPKSPALNTWVWLSHMTSSGNNISEASRPRRIAC